ncbi:leucine-rich repeat-containing protein 17 [Protopterus annectens]|uniref:leucine-rich repeat-containing protein 17 n=1 Tax=Protopterus annectens TaxID=7888 RepID=UPI001CF94D80|nr:leucine-rich repeat-containing protein 17 [Protopterus annectens]
MMLAATSLLLLLCTAVDPWKVKNGHLKNKVTSRDSNASTRVAVHVKRSLPTIVCDEYTYREEKYIDCDDKQLLDISQYWPEDVIHMLLVRNNIQRLYNDMFSRYRNLKSLDLQQNLINKIEEQAFDGLFKLTVLLLQYNQIKVLSEEVFIPLPRLNYLRLYENPWNCTCELEGLIKKLQLPWNRNLGNYAKCEHPGHLSGQKLKQVNTDGLCPDYDTMHPSRSPLEGPRPIVKEVDASLCKIYMYPRPEIDCRYKGLKQIPTDIPTNVLQIDLSNNNITKLKPNVFCNNKDLKILNLSNNAIEHIDPAAFSGLLNLQELDLTNNVIQNFEYGVLEDLYFMQKLWLEHNPWRCDYNIHYLVYWLKHHFTVEHKGLTCSTPKQYKGWSVIEYIKRYDECPEDYTIQKEEINSLHTNSEEKDKDSQTKP